ncbi:hypothetical protein PVAR5_5623 [Paecilomyces variotii No. 5]|uniref:Major facilitator superfamily (MFS) profile domain-containing protein n=1 Tax=Byssochlamys spectabilis (strain No. 5 / NBRC 109023) TaxID=1356009 RepID=V5I283_BYSSN|nr:hypothetical protein PVAR5_5623 [Paecilomyces variotii No. 5]
MSSQTQTETFVLQTQVPGQSSVERQTVGQGLENHEPPEIKWFRPKIFSCGLSFFVAGFNDGSLGAIIPYMIRSYNIETNKVAIVYGTTFLGWFFAAFTNSYICRYLDLGGILCLGAAIQILGHALRTWLPPFPLYAVTFFLASLGQAYNDTHANTFVSSVKFAHRWLGFIHAMYMAGCLAGPFIATAIASRSLQTRWYLFYLVPLGLSVANLALIGTCFRDRLAPLTTTRQGRDNPTEPAISEKTATKEIKDTLRTPSVWLLSLFFFFFLGATITVGGWMVEYLIKVRNGDFGDMGYVPAGLYGGSFLGRLLLAEPTYRFGERRMILIYAVLCVGLQLVFWLAPNIITEAVAVSLMGFFSGPFFATGISAGSKIFPHEIKSSAIAFVFVLGQIGGSVFPAVTGIIAAQAGVRVLQPMLVGLVLTQNSDDRVICPHQIAQTADNLDNPYRKYILPLAHERIGLLCAVLGLSACHLGFLQNDALLTQTVAVEYQLRAIQALGEAIEKGNKATLDENEIDTILATIQILILHDICESGISLHGVHVAGAISILNQLVASDGLNRVSEKTTLFLGNLVWLDIIRAFSGVERLCHSRELREKVVSTCDKKFEMVNGCPRAIFSIIGRAFDYAKAHSLGEIPKHDYQTALESAKQELYAWKIDRDTYPSEDHRWQFVADAFRHACILRVLRLSDEHQPAESPEIQRSVTAILDAVSEIPSDCPLLELLVLPLFMAGADASSPFARHYVLIRIEDIKGRSHFQNPMPKNLLRKVWDARACQGANDNRNVPWMTFTCNPALERQHDFLII